MEELIEFVDNNFNVIKYKFLQDEIQMINEFDENIYPDKEKHLKFIKNIMDNVLTTEQLIKIINERSLGNNLEEDSSELLNMIKNILK